MKFFSNLLADGVANLMVWLNSLVVQFVFVQVVEVSMDDRSSSAKAMAMVSNVMTIAFMMVVPAFLGWCLDNLLGTVVVFMALGLIVGVVAGGWQLLKLVHYLEEQTDKDDSES